MSRIHWSPREKSLVNALNLLSERKQNSAFRIVDLGCGPGLLSGIKQLHIDAYWGIDTDKKTIDYCKKNKEKWPNIKFSYCDFMEESFVFAKNDILILNGVVHHLNDHQLGVLLHKARRCAAMIITDHYRFGRCKHMLPPLMQALDRGKFVRSYDCYNVINGFEMKNSVIYKINIFRITFWLFFCNMYEAINEE